MRLAWAVVVSVYVFRYRLMKSEGKYREDKIIIVLCSRKTRSLMTHQRSMVWSVTAGCGVVEILSSALFHLSFLPASCGRARVRAVRVSWSVAAAEEWERL